MMSGESSEEIEEIYREDVSYASEIRKRNKPKKKGG